MVLSMPSDTTQHIDNNSIFGSAVLYLTNQFSELYHNTIDGTQGFVLLCEPSFTVKLQ